MNPASSPLCDLGETVDYRYFAAHEVISDVAIGNEGKFHMIQNTDWGAMCTILGWECVPSNTSIEVGCVKV